MSANRAPATDTGRRYRRWLCLALLTVVVGLTHSSALAVEVTVTCIDGATIDGEVTGLSRGLVVRGEDGRRDISWDDVLNVRFYNTAQVDAVVRLPLLFTLVDGTAFRGRIVTAEDSTLKVALAVGEPLAFETSALRAVEATAKDGDTDARFAQLRDADTGETDDVILVAKPDGVLELRGVAEKVAASDVRFVWNGRPLTVPWDRVAGLRLANAATEPGRHSVRLCSGDVLTGEISAADKTHLEMRSPALGDLRVPLDSISRIECRGGRLVYLSSLEPSRYEFEPMFAKHWPYVVDETLTHRPIRMGDRAFARGICLHSHATLTYSLAGAYTRFLADVGVVDEMAERGNAHVRVLGDGKTLWEAEAVRGGMPPLPCSVDIVGVRELSLEVDFGGDLDLSDHVGWGDARLIRTATR